MRIRLLIALLISLFSQTAVAQLNPQQTSGPDPAEVEGPLVFSVPLRQSPVADFRPDEAAPLGALSNLTPFQPQGWSAAVVVSLFAGTNTDTVPIGATDTLFIDWAVANLGTGNAGGFQVDLLVDEVVAGSWTVDSLDSNFFVSVEDFEVGPLAPGSHEFRLVVDVLEEVSESNEGDNAFSRTIQVEGTAMPNLAPFQPDGWSSEVVVSTLAGDNQDAATLTSADRLFVDWAVINNGMAGTEETFFVTLLVDGAEVGSWFTDPPLEGNFFVFVEDFQLGPLAAGQHEFRLEIDSNDAIDESNENDNLFIRQVQVEDATGGDEEILIIFPSIRQGGGLGTGVALANPTSQPALAELFLLDGDGVTIGTNMLTVAPDGQLARTVNELFPRVPGDDNAWMVVRSRNLGLVGFFLTFQGSAENIDGAEAVVRMGTVAVYPQVLCGEEDFTEISLIGAGAVDLELRAADGSLLETETVQLPPSTLGRFNQRISELFQTEVPADGAYLLARSRQFSITGYEAFGTDNFLGGRNAIIATEIGREIPVTLYGAQLAEVAALESTVTLINPTPVAANLTLSAFATGVSSGNATATTQLVLPPRGMVRRTAQELLGLNDFVGWLRVDSTVAGVIGDISFGDPNGTYLASVQLQRTPSRRVVASHVADGLGFFTGLTFLNTNSDPAVIELEVFNVNSQRTGQAEITLQALEHRPRLLSELIPGFQPQVGGYVRISADPGVFAFELFSLISRGTLLSLAAVPPQRGSGTVTGQLNTPQTAAAVAHDYPQSRARGIVLDPQLDIFAGDVLVKFRPGASPASLGAVKAATASARWIQGGGNVWLMSLEKDPLRLAALQSPENSETQMEARHATLSLVEQFNGEKSVLYAEPNYRYRAMGSVVPNDEFFPLQWHYDQINLREAWGITTGDPNVVIAVIDTGAKFGHPDLGPRLTGGQFDFINDLQNSLDGDGMDGSAEDPGDDPQQLSSSYHGTHVAGTVGAATGNGQGVAGVNHVSPLMTLRALGALGGGSFDLAQSVLYAARLPNASGQLPNRRANVINMSLGSFGSSQTLADAVAAALNAGTVVVAAAGNENTDRQAFPAGFTGVISVGATDLAGGRASYSNFGNRIDVMGPGGDVSRDLNGDGFADGVLSTLWRQSDDTPLFQFYEGTSMATPHVAGVASLLLAVNPNLSPAQIRQILQNTAFDLGLPGRDNTFGFGLVDPLAALQAAGAAPVGGPLLVLSTTSLNLGTTRTMASVIVSNGGGGQLQIQSPTVEVDQASGWLSASLERSTLIISVNRQGLAEDNYTGRVRLNSNGGNATIEVAMQVGPAGGGDVGTLFVLALDPFGLETLGSTQTSEAEEYRFRLSPLLAGSYFIVAGSDNDQDGFICDDGEFCGFFPVANEPSFVDVEANQTRSGIIFGVQPGAGVAQAPEMPIVIPKEGFPVRNLDRKNPGIR